MAKKPTYCKECKRGEGEHYDHCSRARWTGPFISVPQGEGTYDLLEVKKRGQRFVAEPVKNAPPRDAVNHPAHYGGKESLYETIKVIEAWGLGFNLGNAVKYISRAGLKDEAKHLEDLRKARWYLDRAIMNMEGGTK